jgi:hypothetical protein
MANTNNMTFVPMLLGLGAKAVNVYVKAKIVQLKELTVIKQIYTDWKPHAGRGS